MISVVCSLLSCCSFSCAAEGRDTSSISFVYPAEVSSDSIFSSHSPLGASGDVSEESNRKHERGWSRLKFLTNMSLAANSAKRARRKNKGNEKNRFIPIPGLENHESPSTVSTLQSTLKCSDHFFSSTCLSFSPTCNWCCDAPVGKQCFNVSEIPEEDNEGDFNSSRMKLQDSKGSNNNNVVKDITRPHSDVTLMKKMSLYEYFAKGLAGAEKVYEGCSAEAMISNPEDSCAARCASFGTNCSACESHSWCVYCLEYNVEESRETFSSVSSMEGTCQSPLAPCRRGGTTQKCSNAVEKIPPLALVRVNTIANAVCEMAVLTALLAGSTFGLLYAMKRMRAAWPRWISRAKEWRTRIEETRFWKWIRRYFCDADASSMEEGNDPIQERVEGAGSDSFTHHQSTTTSANPTDLERLTESMEDYTERRRSALGMNGGSRDAGILQRNLPPSALLLSAILSRDPQIEGRLGRRSTRREDIQLIRSTPLPSDSTLDPSCAPHPSSSSPGQTPHPCHAGREAKEKEAATLLLGEKEEANPPASPFLDCFELCCLCLEAPAAVTYLPCHHTCCCELCSNRLRPCASSPSAERSIVCPLCRTTINAMVSLPQIFGLNGSRK